MRRWLASGMKSILGCAALADRVEAWHRAGTPSQTCFFSLSLAREFDVHPRILAGALRLLGWRKRRIWVRLRPGVKVYRTVWESRSADASYQ
ncbi:MAG: hypothetical protein LT103_04700 [Burkholderiaceae bacterium]|nr:hypothetical protein [Burkholderiaceae bacterium]